MVKEDRQAAGIAIAAKVKACPASLKLIIVVRRAIG